MIAPRGNGSYSFSTTAWRENISALGRDQRQPLEQGGRRERWLTPRLVSHYAHGRRNAKPRPQRSQWEAISTSVTSSLWPTSATPSSKGGGSGGHCLGGSPSLCSDECDPLQPGRGGGAEATASAPRHYAGDRQNAEPDPRGRDGMPPAKAGGRAMPTGHKRDVRDWPHRAQRGRERRRGSSSAPPASA